MRKLTLDLDAVALAVAALPEAGTDEMARAARARELLTVIMHGRRADGGELDARYLASLPDAVFEDAHAVVAGGEGRPALKAAAEDIDPDAFAHGQQRMRRLRPSPDPGVAGEFV